MSMLGRNIYSYALGFISIALILAGTWYAFPVFGLTNILLFTLFLLVINVWFSGFKYGLVITFVAAVNTIYFFVARREILSNINLLSILLLVLVSLVTSYAIEKYKKTDIVGRHRQKEKEYLEKMQRLEEEKNKMEKEIRLRDEFLSIASHELKTPLTTMLLRLQTILHNIRHVSLAKFSVENLLKSLETAEQQSQRLSRMINDLLNVSLITTGKFNLEREKTNLTDLVREIVAEFEDKFKSDGYSLKLKADKPIIMYVDKLRIEQAITNLISNALKYGDHKPIELKVEKDGSHAKIIIRDQGIGIKNTQIKKLFMLFERGVSDNSYKGLGVGLYITNQIVKAHNGALKVKSKPNFGSQFTLELPLRSSN